MCPCTHRRTRRINTSSSAKSGPIRCLNPNGMPAESYTLSNCASINRAIPMMSSCDMSHNITLEVLETGSHTYHADPEMQGTRTQGASHLRQTDPKTIRQSWTPSLLLPYPIHAMCHNLRQMRNAKERCSCHTLLLQMGHGLHPESTEQKTCSPIRIAPAMPGNADLAWCTHGLSPNGLTFQDRHSIRTGIVPLIR